MKITNTNISPMVKQEITDEVKLKANKGKKEEIPAAVYEKEKEVEKATYDKPKTHKVDRATIDKLKMESEMAYGQLRSLVESLLERQGMTWNEVKPTDSIKVDEEARLEAQKLIDEDGPLGVKAVSDNLVNFAKAISGGDASKLEELKTAIDKGFKEAERILGGELPEISQRTYDLTMEKLDAWAEENN